MGQNNLPTQMPIEHIKLYLAARFSQDSLVFTCYSYAGIPVPLSWTLHPGPGLPSPRDSSLYHLNILVTWRFLYFYPPGCCTWFLFPPLPFYPSHSTWLNSAWSCPLCTLPDVLAYTYFSLFSTISFLLHHTLEKSQWWLAHGWCWLLWLLQLCSEKRKKKRKIWRKQRIKVVVPGEFAVNQAAFPVLLQSIYREDTHLNDKCHSGTEDVGSMNNKCLC